MSPRSRFVVLLVVSALACSYGQTATDVPTEGPTEAPTQDETTTTAAPAANTTTTVAPTSTPTPAPAQPTSDPTKDPAQGSWNITENGRTCILSKMGLRVGFTYLNAKNETKTISYDVPAAANATSTTGSTCGASDTADEILAIGIQNDFTLTLTFRYGVDNKNWVVSDVVLEFVMNPTYFPDGGDGQTYSVSLANQTLFQTSNGSSYQCVSDATLQGFVGVTGAPTVNITTAGLRVEAFRQIPGDFSTAIPCPADTEVSNIVPIAVGAALAALVVIVLIAYLIGRKKNKRGYESV